MKKPSIALRSYKAGYNSKASMKLDFRVGVSLTVSRHVFTSKSNLLLTILF